MNDANLNEILKKVKTIMGKYQDEYPDVQVDRDYFPFKITEEWGECLQAYLMLTDRGRQKGLSKEEIHEKLSDEIADVFGFLLLFANSEKIDVAEALKKKWFKRLEEHA